MAEWGRGILGCRQTSHLQIQWPSPSYSSPGAIHGYQLFLIFVFWQFSKTIPPLSYKPNLTYFKTVSIGLHKYIHPRHHPILEYFITPKGPCDPCAVNLHSHPQTQGIVICFPPLWFSLCWEIHYNLQKHAVDTFSVKLLSVKYYYNAGDMCFPISLTGCTHNSLFILMNI